MAEIDKVKLKSDIYNIADFYSVKSRLIKLMEELGELTQATAKLITDSDFVYLKGKGRDHLTEEIADVLIMIEQVMYLTDEGHHYVEEWVEKKVARQLERMADEMSEDE